VGVIAIASVVAVNLRALVDMDYLPLGGAIGKSSLALDGRASLTAGRSGGAGCATLTGRGGGGVLLSTGSRSGLGTLRLAIRFARRIEPGPQRDVRCVGVGVGVVLVYVIGEPEIVAPRESVIEIECVPSEAGV